MKLDMTLYKFLKYVDEVTFVVNSGFRVIGNAARDLDFVTALMSGRPVPYKFGAAILWMQRIISSYYAKWWPSPSVATPWSKRCGH